MKMTIGISMFASTAVLGAVTAWAYPFGPPNGYTSAPGDKPGIACTQCHVGTPLNGGGGSVRVSFANGLIYTPGQAQTLTVTTWDNLIVGNVFPTTVGGVTVAIDGRPAPISFVNQTEINALVPATGTLGNVSVVVSNATGSSAPATLSLSAAAPGLFTFSQDQGRYPAAVVLDGANSFEYLAPAGMLGSGTQSRPAKAGDSIILYGTAFGPTTTPLSPAMAASVAYPLAHSGPDITQPLAQVTIGGQAAQLQFCGIVSPGVYQVNAVVPSGLSSGDQPLKFTLLSGPSSPQTLFIPIQ